MLRYWSLIFVLFSELNLFVSNVLYLSASEFLSKLIAQNESSLNRGGYLPIDLFTIKFPCRRVLPSHVLWNVSLSTNDLIELRFMPISNPSSFRREIFNSAFLLEIPSKSLLGFILKLVLLVVCSKNALNLFEDQRRLF